MRIPADNGTWKVSGADARLLVPRGADEETGGPFYRLLTEGTIQNYDDVTRWIDHPFDDDLKLLAWSDEESRPVDGPCPQGLH